MPSTALALDADRAAYRLSNFGLEVLRDLSEREWLALGAKLVAMHNGTRWAIGDWLVYGEGRGQYGHTYTKAADITGLSYESLSHSARVSREFPYLSRQIRVSWSHYREACRLPAAIRVAELQRAAGYTWTREQFRKHVGEMTERGLGEAAAAAIEGRPVPKGIARSRRFRRAMPKDSVRCPHCGRSFQIGRKGLSPC